MASSVSSSNPVPPPPAAGRTAQQADKFTVFIDRRLRLTGNHVKLVDLFGGLMMLCGFLLASLLLLSVIDAWIFELNALLRIISLLGILIVSGSYFLFKLLPLLINRINPAYAAKMIEEGHPELKNSLLNHVFFQRDPRGARAAVVGAVHRKAAEDISHITIETAVDRGFLIRAGYFFAGALALFGLYKVLSPKDPFTTMARIAAPFAEIARPSRVLIDDIKPGDVEIFFGERLSIEARISGIGDDEQVSLVFSSEDGQVADRHVLMKRGEEKRIYTSELSSSGGGVQQNLTYWIEAGDGQSRRFNVIVKPRPSFVVQSVKITPPAYTELESYEHQQGNIASVEGATITVRALANLPIDMASIQLLALPDDDQQATNPATATQVLEPKFVESVSMQIVNDSEACGEFWLQMHGDRLAPRYTHYRVSCRTKDGVGNENATVYRIQTTPDLKPEIELVQPRDTISQLPENRKAQIQVRAFDPDYLLSDLRLVGDRRGSHLFEKSILQANAQAAGQVDVVYQFDPREFGLRSGDEILMHALALDNRHAPVSDVLDPNVAKSKQIRIQITSAVEEPAGSDAASSPDQQDDPRGQDQANSRQTPDNPSPKSDRDPGKTTDANDQKQASGDSSKNPGKTADSSQEDSKTDDQQNSEQSKSGESKQQEPGRGGAKSEGSQKEASQAKGEGNESGSESPGNQSKQGRQPNQGSRDGQSSQESVPQNGGQNSGRNSSDTTSPTENSSSSPNGNNQSKPDRAGDRKENTDQQRQDGDTSSGANSDPVDHPGDAFERLKERVEQLQQEREQDSAQPNTGEGQEAKTGDERKQEATKSGQAPDENQGRPRTVGKQSDSSQESGDHSESSSKQSGSKQDDGKRDDGKQAENEKSGLKKDGTEDDTGASGGSGKNGSKRDQPQNDGGVKDNSVKQEGVDQETINQDGAEKKGLNKQGDKASDVQENKAGVAGENSQEQQASPTKSGEQNGGDESGGKSTPNKDSKESKQNTSGQPSGQDATESGEKTPAGDDQSKSQKAGSRQHGKKPAGSSDQQRDSKQDSAGPDGESADQDAAQQKPDNAQPGNKSFDGVSRPGSGNGNRQPSDREFADEGADNSPDGDEANLDHARKATDLVLDYLKDHKEDVDDRLLDDLNWSPAEMRDFYEKWELMRKQAEQGGAAERNRYEEALRSLGLRPRRDGVDGENIRQQKIDGLLEQGNRSQPPAHLLEEFRSFNKARKRVNDR